MEMREYGRPGGPMHEKAICQHDIEKLQSFYWKKYRVRLSKREAEKILIAQMSGRERYDFAHMTPHKGKHPAHPRGPQRPQRR